MPAWTRTDGAFRSNTPEKPGKEADEKLDRLKSWLGRHMRTTRLTDMLIEVDNDITVH